MPNHIYTVFLLKENIAAVADALDPEKHPTPHALTDEFPLEGTLFVGGQVHSTPSWVGMMNPYLAPPIGAVYSASISAVLVVEYEGRLFALTFGHGKSLLRPDVWVRGFGLRATLNRVDASKLRSIDSKIYDDLVVATRRQTSQSSQLDSFDLDVMRALVQGVTGDAEGNAALSRLTGADGLRATSELPFNRLDEFLEEVWGAYEDDSYRRSFGWIDNIQEADPARVDELDALLVQSLANINEGEAYLAPTDVVDWNNIHGFNFTNGVRTVTYMELSLRDYLLIQQNKGVEIDTELLKRHKIRVRHEDDGLLHDQWAVYNCIVWEAEMRGRRFVLFDGRWFEIDGDYAERVTIYIDSISSTSIAFPDSPVADDEDVYNASVAHEFPDTYALLDLQRFRPTGGATDIEFCDLLSSQRQLIHVKKRTSSATLSHLFSQGSVGAELFLQDEGLRGLVNERLVDIGRPDHAELIPEVRPTASDFEVVYAIMARRGPNGWRPLPFFSAVNLMHHATRVQTLGYRVSLQYIPQV